MSACLHAAGGLPGFDHAGPLVGVIDSQLVECNLGGKGRAQESDAHDGRDVAETKNLQGPLKRAKREQTLWWRMESGQRSKRGMHA